MLVRTLLLATLSATALALPQIQRRPDLSNVLDSIDTFSKESSSIQDVLSDFTASSNTTATALKLQAKSDTLLKDIKTETDTVNQASTLSESDSAKVGNAVVELLQNVFSLLDRFVEKKPVFDKAILNAASASSLVEADLKKLKSAVDDYDQAVSSKLSGDIKAIAPILTGDLDFHFTQAIDAFSSK